MAWAVMNGILQGLTPQQKSIRESILSSETASRAIRKSFQKGIKFAERVLVSQDDSFVRSFDEHEIECIIRACEAYGRFSLHEQSSASLKKENQVSLNTQVTLLLKWTTDFVVPALLGSSQADSMLRDLDISHISVSDSMMHGPPGSPSLMSPPRQKPNIGRTPVAMRSQTAPYQRDIPINLTEKIAATLLVSSCMISSEILAMGVSDENGIAKASLEWCSVLEECNMPSLAMIFPSFVRLAVQLNRTSNKLSLLEELLVHCNDFDEDDFPSGYKLVKSALKAARNDEKKFIDLFMKVIDRLVHGDEKWQPRLETASCLTDVWDKGRMMGIFLEVIEGYPSLQWYAAKELASSLASSNGSVTPVIAFQAKCLSALSMVVESNAMSEILRGINTESVDVNENDDIRAFVANLTEANA
jgi:hypothetical protein